MPKLSLAWAIALGANPTEMQRIFGYGSLVNHETHAYGRGQPARLRGWRRIWRHTTRREVAFLNVVPDATAEIDGIIFDTPLNDAGLATREYAYATINVAGQLIGPKPSGSVRLFAISSGEQRAPSDKHAVLLSYVDIVVGGYLREFGEAGVERFFATTTGWDVPIVNDREAPRYSRYVPQGTVVEGLCDAALSRLPCRIVDP